LVKDVVEQAGQFDAREATKQATGKHRQACRVNLICNQ
jgi:hypothetical protein